MHPNHDRKLRMDGESGGTGNIKVEAFKFIMFECLTRDVRHLKIKQNLFNRRASPGLRTNWTADITMF